MKKEELKQILDRCIAGRASPEEVRQLIAYLHLKDGDAILEQLIADAMEETEDETDAEVSMEKQQMFERVEQALQERIRREQQVKIVPIWRKRLYRFTAAAVALLAIGVWLFREAAPRMIVVNTKYGQIKEVMLPDSSSVWLNAGSRFEYPSYFKGKLRQVYLKAGQAFFDVKHRSEHPFSVVTSKVSVVVLGTSFDVKAYADEENIKVTVQTGKVGVTTTGAAKPALYLLPHQQAVINKNSRDMTTVSVKDDVSSWRENKLIFDNETLYNVFRSLERRYNVRFVVSDIVLLKERTSMKLDSQPLSDVLTALSFSKHFNYKMPNDSTVMIR